MSFQYSWIRSFHFTAKFGSIAQASDFLNISSSTISHQIKDLEQKFKVKLFFRSGNRICLTNIGLSLKKITERYFEQENNINLFLAKVKNRMNKVLNIGAENPMKLIPLVDNLRKKQERTKFNLFFEKNDLLLEMFIKNKVDILVLNKLYFENNMQLFAMSKNTLGKITEVEGSQIDSVPFYNDKLILAVHEQHPIFLKNNKKEQKASWKSIMEEKIILPHKSFASRNFFDNLCEKLQIFPHQTMEISSREGVITAIKNNLGIGVVLESEIAERTGITSLPFDLPEGVTDQDLSVEEYVYFNHNIADLSLIRRFTQVIMDQGMAGKQDSKVIPASKKIIKI